MILINLVRIPIDKFNSISNITLENLKLSGSVTLFHITFYLNLFKLSCKSSPLKLFSSSLTIVHTIVVIKYFKRTIFLLPFLLILYAKTQLQKADGKSKQQTLSTFFFVHFFCFFFSISLGERDCT
jgi:hypothetical protein